MQRTCPDCFGHKTHTDWNGFLSTCTTCDGTGVTYGKRPRKGSPTNATRDKRRARFEARKKREAEKKAKAETRRLERGYLKAK